MAILDKLFILVKRFRRPKKGSIDIVTIPPTDTPPENSRASYYATMLLELNLEPLTKKKDYKKVLSNIPNDKVVVFFNMQLFEVISEQDFVALDEYINLAKENKVKEAFYRGLRHGPAVLNAFSKDLIPENFNVDYFLVFPVVAVYL